MIDRREIFEGNYITDVWASAGSAFKVISLNSRTVKYGANFVCRWENILPVPLTEEILLKCKGVSQDDDCFYFLMGTIRVMLTYRHYHWNLYNLDEDCVLAMFDHLHELQNIYYWLSGKKELEVKL